MRKQLENELKEFFKKKEGKELIKKDREYLENLYKIILHEILNNNDLDSIFNKYGMAGVFVTMRVFSENKIYPPIYLLNKIGGFREMPINEKKAKDKSKDKLLKNNNLLNLTIFILIFLIIFLIKIK